MLILLLAMLQPTPSTLKEKPDDAQWKNYETAYKEAEAKGIPLVVFVGQKAHNVAGCVWVRWDGYPELGESYREEGGVVVGKGGKEIRRLPGKPTAAQIQEVWKPKSNTGHSLEMPHSSLPIQEPAVPRGVRFARGGC